MTTILQYIGWFLLKIYQLIESLGIPGAYALALVVFTILIKIILFPLSYKGKKSMMQMNALQGRIKKLEAQYGKDKERYQLEVQKLYQKENINPMGGCLWSLLPLPILMGLYYIIRRPMLYMMSIPATAITTAIEAASDAGVTFSGSSFYQELQLAGMLDQPAVLAIVQKAIPEYADKLTAINFNMFGINLGTIPTLKFWTTFDTLGVWPSVGLFCIPLVVTALNFFYTRYSTKTNAALTNPDEGKKKKKNATEQKSSTERTTSTMMWVMPLMYLYFGYIMPAGMCVYMAVNAVCTIGQDLICVKVMSKSFREMQEQQRIAEEREAAELAARREELAARRQQQEEERRNRKKKSGKSAPASKPKNTAGRIGIRTYALGRDYDPDRYGGVTAYRDPQEIIDEQALEESYKNKRSRKKEAVEQAITKAEEIGDVERVKALEAEQAALEAADAAAEEAFAAEDEEIAALPEAPETAPEEEA